MSTHIYHGGIIEEGLNDNCPRCTEHAEHPFVSLDNSNLHMLARMVQTGATPRTENEAVAMSHIKEVLWYAEKLQNLGIVI